MTDSAEKVRAATHVIAAAMARLNMAARDADRTGLSALAIRCDDLAEALGAELLGPRTMPRQSVVDVAAALLGPVDGPAAARGVIVAHTDRPAPEPAGPSGLWGDEPPSPAPEQPVSPGEPPTTPENTP